MKRNMHHRNYRFLTPLIMALAWANMEAQTASPVPRLVVNVMIDQLRTDYVEAFSTLFGTEGFNRIMREGRTYVDVSYPFAHVDRASAVACVMTGTVPYDNGIVGERWMDRKTLRPAYCVDDASCQGWLTSEKYSPASLNVSTITDELKMFYCRGLHEWPQVPSYLTDTCLTAQDHYKHLLDYFRIKY